MGHLCSLPRSWILWAQGTPSLKDHITLCPLFLCAHFISLLINIISPKLPASSNLWHGFFCRRLISASVTSFPFLSYPFSSSSQLLYLAIFKFFSPNFLTIKTHFWMIISFTSSGYLDVFSHVHYFDTFSPLQ